MVVIPAKSRLVVVRSPCFRGKAGIYQAGYQVSPDGMVEDFIPGRGPDGS